MEKIYYRHEEKYICSLKEIGLIKRRISPFLTEDMHYDSVGGYRVRSIYFDTLDDKFLNQVLDGVEEHRKYRIRAYNRSKDTIKLEMKESFNEKKRKTTENITMDCFANILSGNYGKINTKSNLLSGIMVEHRKNRLIPVVIVDYYRQAYCHSFGNIRITFDTYLSASRDILSFWDEYNQDISILPPGLGVMEVKFDGCLPGYLKRLLDDFSLERISFSKYAGARLGIGRML